MVTVGDKVYIYGGGVNADDDRIDYKNDMFVLTSEPMLTNHCYLYITLPKLVFAGSVVIAKLAGEQVSTDEFSLLYLECMTRCDLLTRRNIQQMCCIA